MLPEQMKKTDKNESRVMPELTKTADENKEVMLPEWMKKTDEYKPPEGGSRFAVKTIKTIGKIMSRLKVQKGHEKRFHIPAILKLIFVVAAIIVISICRAPIVLMAFAAALLAYLCTWPARDLWSIISVSGIAALITLLLLIPAMIIKPAGSENYMILAMKVFMSVALVSIFNHTTQWNHITQALRRMHVPGIFVFTLDITLKYIVLMGNLITELLTAYLLRAVGNSNGKRSSAGGVLGVTFLRGTEMNRQMYEAMQCRGFTDDYKGL